MAGTGFTAYDDDELTDEERKLLETDNTIPPAEDDDSNPVPIETIEAEAGVTKAPDPAAAAPAPAAAAPAAEAAPPAAAAAPAGATDAELAAFLEANKGKTPEELATALFQQNKRASTAGFQARRTAAQLQQIQERAREAQARQQQFTEQIGTDRERFKALIQDDPDKALSLIFDKMTEQTGAVIDDAADEAAVTAAVELAETAIPGFGQLAGQVRGFGREMNFSEEELAGIRDGRQLVTLHLASVAGQMIKAGLIDVYGRVRALPPAVDNSDPRLAPGRAVPQTLSGLPASAPAAGKTVEGQLQDFLSMSDEDFAKLDPKTLEAVLAQA